MYKVKDMEKFDRNEIIHHMARAFFASAWADACEEYGNAHLIGGTEIMDVMPVETDPSAIEAAKTLADGMERDNGATLAAIAAWCAYAKAKHGKDGGDRPVTNEMFGHYCAMQAMGHGVGLYDAFGQAVYYAVKVPNVEFGAHYLEKCYFDGQP